MRVKTSITFPADLLERLDRVDSNRSALLERAAVAWLAHLERAERDRRDVGIIDHNAARLNSEAEDTLEYQQPFIEANDQHGSARPNSSVQKKRRRIARTGSLARDRHVGPARR